MGGKRVCPEAQGLPVEKRCSGLSRCSELAGIAAEGGVWPGEDIRRDSPRWRAQPRSRVLPGLRGQSPAFGMSDDQVPCYYRLLATFFKVRSKEWLLSDLVFLLVFCSGLMFVPH